MRISHAARRTAIVLAASVALSAGSTAFAKTTSQPVIPQTSNWGTTVSITDNGAHAIGNPNAKIKLDEFVSYTCPHCSHFAKDGDGALQLAYVGSGKVQVTVHNFIRDSVDLTAALLANCGPASKFKQNHMMFMLQQPKWLEKAERASDGQKKRWNTGDLPARMRSIASALGFYDMMATRGYSRVEADRCLSNKAMADKLVQGTKSAIEQYNIPGTPSFVLDGNLLAGTFTWEMLQPQLDARF
ncbi:thioredoxin domain-containing protein [Tsuneonella flava]|uniref:Thioredoxin domain-containing protein n=1 Tax=Tsuneonella flava TaxID=2055955 RepID=A0ABX7KEB6_9SPHN|nr:thioredoxin domain-containing protein [Tsuneonella flava]QSB45626.1 thioredoxin domain-containing protein [Tsuneonella flava]